MSAKTALSLVCTAHVLLFCSDSAPGPSSEFETKKDAAVEETSSELACTFRFFNCDNDPATGCETDTIADNNNCGGCGKTCATQCVAGACARPDCPKGMWECNQNGSDGCETNLDTNPTSCGECAHSCQGSACTGGVCGSTVLSKGKDSPFGIATNATHVFFTTADGNVVRTALDGSGERVIASGRKNLRAIQVDATHVYWTEEGLGDNDGILGRATLDGVCATTCPDVVASLLEHPRAFAMDSQNAYIVNFALGGKDGSIVKVAKTGGTAEKILPGLERPWGIAADPNTIFYTQENKG
ncbi:MAG: hypothetical protein KBF88_07785, partial [Polyangiaceae bacterium]|nr:hypothetical protein [Polyangiaceae bacterium]